ncbi:MAG: hypothetical protein IJ729_04975 [Alloprevotella sp.]|nr:hypothetical protein [Alloprevotella sp.]
MRDLFVDALPLFLRLGWIALFLYAFWGLLRALAVTLGRRPLWDYRYNVLLCLAGMAFAFWVVYAGEFSRLSAPWYWQAAHFAVLSLLLCPFGWLCARVFGLARGRAEGGPVTLNHLARVVLVLFGWTMAVVYEYHALPCLQG